MRLVLTGPAPCELVDAKICLTFRIFVKLPSGSMFCSTQDLELVRPEVNQGIPNNLFDFVYLLQVVWEDSWMAKYFGQF